jgi:hypothetical protein
MNEHVPPGWLFPLIMAVAVSLLIALMTGYHHITNIVDRSSAKVKDKLNHARSPRSPVRRSWVVGRSLPRTRSNAPNATLPVPDATFASREVSRSGSDVQDGSPSGSDLELTLDEIAYGMLAVAYRTRNEEPTKEAAIVRAFPNVTSKGGGSWQRASKVYDIIKSADTIATKQEHRPTDHK